MDALTSVRNAITSCPTRSSSEAMRPASKVAFLILGSADAGMRPISAQASHARISIRSHRSYLCWSDHSARMAGGKDGSIKEGEGSHQHWGRGDYIRRGMQEQM